jgi:hypothetical protein
MKVDRIVTMSPEGMGTARGNCDFLDVSTILSKGGVCGCSTVTFTNV